MTTANFSSTPSNASDTAFRAWALALHNAIASLLTYVAQTGEIDFTTVLTPSAANQKRGFRIYRFNDSLQATHPVFIRIDYGSGTAAADPSLWIQIGQAVDGSGNLSVPITGSLQVTDQVKAFSTLTVAALDSYVSGDASRLTLCLWPLGVITASNTITATIERSKDSSGADTSAAVHLLIAGSARVSRTFQLNGRCIQNDSSGFKIPFNQTFTTALWGSQVSLFPTIHFGDNLVFNAITGFLIYGSADLAGLFSESLNIYGASHNYVFTGRGLGLTDGSSGITRQLAVRND